ncbi:MAG TPA: GatB/YqeY domain-containing protein [Hyphomicrobiaceae bacterium]|nr:GatB/YqeY domain-containing protein [Hyphomicrobiaceae bacterium]
MRDRLQQETKRALKAQDKARLGALRLISAALKDREIAQRTDTLSDQEVVAVLQRMLKQRRESFAIYAKAGRQDLADQEAREIAVIEEFLPAQMGEAEVKAAIAGIIAEVGASGPKDMGKVMAALKERYAGQIDMGKASGLAKALLG